MPIPDISRPVRTDGKTIVLKPPTANVAIAASPVPAGKVHRIRTLLAANISINTLAFTVWLTKGGVDTVLFNGVGVPRNTTFSAITSNTAIYLEEGDSLKVSSSLSAGVHFTVSYEEFTG